MKENIQIKKENGQIIVLLALSLVVVMIVAALAVDGGMIYSERRFAQNVADAASLAGGGSVLEVLHNDGNFVDLSCPAYSSVVYNQADNTFTSSNIVTLAYYEARDNAITSNNLSELPFLGYERNGVVDPDDNSRIDQKHGVVINCVYTEDYEKHLDVEVRITSQVSTAFAHLIFPSPLETTNVAVTSTIPSFDLGQGKGIVSLSPDCQNNTDGMEFTGTGDVTIYGGGVHSNSCLTGSGNVVVDAFDSLSTPGSITLVGDNATINGGAILNPLPSGNAKPVPTTVINPPDCASTYNSIEDPKKGDIELTPGSYSGLKMTGGVLSLKPGMYCFNGDIEITGGTVISGGPTYNDGVTIYMKNGDIGINGNATVRLIAPYKNINDYYYGMLIYMDPNNSGLITLVGNEDSIFTGTIYAPSGSVELGGVSSMDSTSPQACKLVPDTSTEDPNDLICEAGTFSTQIVAWYVKVVGTTQMDIIYDSSLVFTVPSNLFLRQ